VFNPKIVSLTKTVAISILSLIVLYFVFAFVFGLPALDYVDDCYHSVHAGDTQQEVKEALSKYSENIISYEEIPDNYRLYDRPTDKDVKIAKYTYIIDWLSFIVIYDENHVVVRKIPLYE
jgi:hypothetical protein